MCQCTLVPWSALLAILAMLHGSSFFEAHVDYFLEFFFKVKVQIHAVISCHTKLAPSSLNFIVIFWLPPGCRHGPGLLMMMVTRKVKIKILMYSLDGWLVSLARRRGVCCNSRNSRSLQRFRKGQRMTSPVLERTRAVRSIVSQNEMFRANIHD